MQVARVFPEFRLTRVDDYYPQDIESEKQYHQGSECIAAASGDYFGDKSLAYAFLVLASNGDFMALVAHKTTNQEWKIEQLGDVEKGNKLSDTIKFNCYLNTLEAGSYSDITLDEGGDPDTNEPGRVEHLTSKHAGIIFGTIEATGVAYFYVDGHWVHTYVID